MVTKEELKKEIQKEYDEYLKTVKQNNCRAGKAYAVFPAAAELQE